MLHTLAVIGGDEVLGMKIEAVEVGVKRTAAFDVQAAAVRARVRSHPDTEAMHFSSSCFSRGYAYTGGVYPLLTRVGITPAFDRADPGYLNRRGRNRTHGGVGGRRG